MLSDPSPLALTTWTEQDGTTVWVVPSAAGCSPGGAPDAVPLAYVRQVPGERPVLEGYRDAREDVTVWGGTVLGRCRGERRARHRAGAHQRAARGRGGEVGDLVAVTDEAGATVAQVARVSEAGPHGRDVTALLWRAEAPEGCLPDGGPWRCLQVCPAAWAATPPGTCRAPPPGPVSLGGWQTSSRSSCAPVRRPRCAG